MNVELGKLKTGAPMIMSDCPLPHRISRVEYYRDQKYIMLIYDAPDHDGELLTYELSNAGAELLEKSGSILVVDHTPDRVLVTYDVSIIKV